ncbi:MBL fold metallo-hydrolase [bacterium]|nr:MBL fold metallo-hydrolase [bacterium]
MGYIHFFYVLFFPFPMRWSAVAAEAVTIRWWGHAMVSIESIRGLTVVIDPYGLHLEAYDDPQVRGDLVLASHNHSDHVNVDLVKGDPIVLKGLNAGEVEPINAVLDLPENASKPRLTPISPKSKNVFSKHAVRIEAIAAYHDKQQGKRKGNNAMFLVEVDGLRVLHTGDIGQAELIPGQIERAAGVDVLIIPVGGKNTVNAQEALVIIHQLNPKYVIPIHYGVEGLRLKLDTLDMFLEILPHTFERVLVHGNAFAISQEKEPIDTNTKVIILEPRPYKTSVESFEPK